MSALAIHPTQVRPSRSVTGARRGHLQLVGPGFVPAVGTAPAQSPVAAPVVARPRVRLTARGRMVRSVLALVVGMVLAIGAGGWLGSALRPAEYTGPVETVSVGAGDTVWGIAASTTTADADVRDVVDDILRLNGLSSAQLTTGQQLLVPAG